ncbi:hypothetical protein CYY_002562 [Polysphondylium violaceum]|uniref:Isochorismatase-like domain-containing protein n=1 Tax=Polysphondylium violaceum TaxID=133409 RepID=A0A8J4V0S1_9MYCE|nr:hypothetical protein CYY_002562 [Polysphondylium violaceum]
MKALIIVDMVNDLYDGVLNNEKYANTIIPGIQTLLEHCRKNASEWVIVYSNDAHREGDPELKIWGPHAMEGTKGAEVIPALKPTGAENEVISGKRFYSAFDGTGLKEILEEKGVNECVVVGQHTHCCVRHTCNSIYMLSMAIKVPSDCVCVFEGQDNQQALEYLKAIYGATITTSDEIINSSRTL